MSGEHAPLPPSFAPVWVECAGSIRASAGRPNLDTAETLKGSAAHWVGASVLDLYVRFGTPANCNGFIGSQAPNGVIVDDDIVAGAQTYVDDVVAVIGSHVHTDLQIFIEQCVEMPGIHPDNWGTLDCAVYVRSTGTLYIWDYKHGHREVRATGNWQLIDYLQGLAERLGINGAQDQHINVVARIVQPFCYRNGGPVDEWRTVLADLRPYFNRISAAAYATQDADPSMTTGGHCAVCPGRVTCSALRRADYNLIDVAQQPFELDDMSSRDLSAERRIMRDGLAAAKKRLEAIEDELVHRVQAGDTETGLALQTSEGRLKWTVPDAQAVAFAAQFGIDAKVETVCTPTQAANKAPKAMKAAFKQAYKSVTARPAGAVTLVDAENSLTARAFRSSDNA